MKPIAVPLLLMAAFLSASVAHADNRSRLYTEPDPASQGGIQGHIASPSLPIEMILALPQDEISFVYEGTITGDDKRGFRFQNLPMRKYDLVVIHEDSFVEGLQLYKGESTLTQQDKAKIDQSIQKSEPFFNDKTIHRVEGETGRGNMARALITYFSGKKTFSGLGNPEGKDYRRTFKLVLLKDVGPGWQIVTARDLYPLSVGANDGNPAHAYSVTLSSLRVTDSIKDLGELNLSRPGK
jgi:hypothetical protein